MKKLLIIFTLLFSVMFSSTSFAEWQEVSINEDYSHTFYVDFKSINKIDGYIYYWLLINFSKPDKNGALSVKNYRQTDCKLMRHKDLTFLGYKQPMGEGKPKQYNVASPGWVYSPPDSVNNSIMRQICSD